LRVAGRERAEKASWEHHITALRSLYKEVALRKHEMFSK